MYAIYDNYSKLYFAGFRDQAPKTTWSGKNPKLFATKQAAETELTNGTRSGEFAGGLKIKKIAT